MQAERDQRIKQDVTHMQRAFYCQVRPPLRAVYDCCLKALMVAVGMSGL